MRLRLIQTLNRRQSISNDNAGIEYEESEDECMLSSSLSSSNADSRRLSSSVGIYSNSSIEPNQRLRQSTPCLYQSPNKTKTQRTNSSTIASSSSTNLTKVE